MESELDSWLDEIREELGEDHPGTKEYNEVVEKAEEMSKEVESISNPTRGSGNTLSLRTDS